jgi:hypothetical protein
MIASRPKRKFNVNDSNDCKAFEKFLKNSAWGKDGCPFEIEEPWVSIPDMIKDKLARKHLGINK